MSVAARCLSVIGSAILGGCGYVGDPLPPALNIPVAVDDLSAIQRGNELVIQFTVPRMTTDGLVLKTVGGIDLRVGIEGVRPFDMPTWEAGAHRIEVADAGEPGRVRVETPAGPFAGREVILGVRVCGHKDRWSEWSNLVPLEAVEPLRPPSHLRAEAVRDGVRVSWRSENDREGIRYRISRRVDGGGQAERVGEAAQTEWVDTGTEYDKSYEYRVQAVVAAGDQLAESEWTPPVAVTPQDRFPPAVPTGLTAIAGMNTVELTWDRGQEPDLAFYRVYRSIKEEASRRIADSVAAPDYSDASVQSGRRYTYTVTAVDLLGNESEPSAAVDITVP